MNGEKLFTESLNFIKMNLDVTFDNVPEHLMSFWRINELPNKEDLASTMQRSVFMYALLLYKQEKNIMKFKMRIEEFILLFNTW